MTKHRQESGPSRLAGIRIYTQPATETISPLGSIYCEIVSYLLCREAILTPGYRELFVYLTDAKELPRESAPTHWKRDIQVSFDFESFREATDVQQARMLHSAVWTALQQIMKEDRLAPAVMQRVLESLLNHVSDGPRAKCLETTTSKYRAVLWYLARRCSAHFKLSLHDLNTGKVRVRELIEFNHVAFLTVQTDGVLRLKKRQIVVESTHFPHEEYLIRRPLRVCVPLSDFTPC